MNGQIVFQGNITTVTPYANSPAGCVNADKVRLLPRMPVDGVAHPVVSASTIRAWLRMAAADVLRGRLGQVSFDDIALAAIGGVKGDEREEGKLPVDLRAGYARRQHLIGLFGAGDSPAGFVTGAWVISEAVAPPNAVAIVEGSRRALNQDVRLAEFLDLSELTKIRDYGLANQARSRAASEVKKLVSELRKTKDEAARAKIQAALAAAKSAQTGATDAARSVSSNPIGMPLPGYEVIGSATSMPHEMRINMAGDVARLGLGLATLEQAGLEPVIGAHKSQGCGVIRASWDVSHRQIVGRRVTLTPLGRVSIDPLGGTSIDGQVLLDAMQEWDEADLDEALYRANYKIAAKQKSA